MQIVKNTTILFDPLFPLFKKPVSLAFEVCFDAI